MVDRDPELETIEQQIRRLMQASDLTLQQRSSMRESIYGLSYECPYLLYDKYREIITSFITIKVLRSISGLDYLHKYTQVLPSITRTTEILLNQVRKGFEDLMYGMRRISGYLRVMDKVANGKNLLSLEELVITCFRDMVFDTYKVQASLTDC